MRFDELLKQDISKVLFEEVEEMLRIKANSDEKDKHLLIKCQGFRTVF